MNILNVIKKLFTKQQVQVVSPITLDFINKLDTTKTYVALEIGYSSVAKIIQALEHKVYGNVSPNELASHAFALRFKNGQWYVWENHLKWGGIKEYPLSEYNAGSCDKLLVKPYPLDLTSMDYWLKHNPGYSCLNLAEITIERLTSLTLPDTKGWVCSQAIAACNFNICLDLNQEFQNIAPADFQVYLKG